MYKLLHTYIETRLWRRRACCQALDQPLWRIGNNSHQWYLLECFHLRTETIPVCITFGEFRPFRTAVFSWNENFVRCPVVSPRLEGPWLMTSYPTCNPTHTHSFAAWWQLAVHEWPQVHLCALNKCVLTMIWLAYPATHWCLADSEQFPGLKHIKKWRFHTCDQEKPAADIGFHGGRNNRFQHQIKLPVIRIAWWWKLRLPWLNPEF